MVTDSVFFLWVSCSHVHHHSSASRYGASVQRDGSVATDASKNSSPRDVPRKGCKSAFGNCPSRFHLQCSAPQHVHPHGPQWEVLPPLLAHVFDGLDAPHRITCGLTPHMRHDELLKSPGGFEMGQQFAMSRSVQKHGFDLVAVFFGGAVDRSSR